MDNQEFPFHNGAFESFVSSSTEKISMFIRLKIDYL